MQNLNKVQKKVIDSLLNSPYDRLMCENCGNYRSHASHYCGECGGLFKVNAGVLIDALRIAENRKLKDKRPMLRPQYIAAVYKKTLVDAGIGQRQFTRYVTGKL